MYLFKDINESNKDEELEKVYRLIQFYREKGIQDYISSIIGTVVEGKKPGH